MGLDETKSGEARYMFRVGKDLQNEAFSRPNAELVMMGEKPMPGFIFVVDDDLSDESLEDWLKLALSYVAALPPKKAKPPKTKITRKAYTPSFAFNISLTAAGLALPPVAFMT